MKTLYLLLLVVCFSCAKVNNDIKFKPKFVVEGFIEEGNFPIVKITHNIPIDYILNEDQLEKLIVRYAKVRVHNSEEEEILTLIYDKDNFPYFYYTGRKLKGKAGKSYKLEVIYNNIVLESETYIPIHKPLILSSNFKKIDDLHIQPILEINNNTANANYRFHTKHQGNQQYTTTSPKGFRGIDEPLNQPKSVALLRNKPIINMDEDDSHYYKLTDSIDIKVSNVDSTIYALWMEYAQQSVQFSFLNFSENFKGNIKGDGIGIWYGVNAVTITQSYNQKRQPTQD